MRSPIEKGLIAMGALALVVGWLVLLRLALAAGSVWLLAILIALLLWVAGRLIGSAIAAHARRRRATRLAELAKQCCADDVRFLMRRPSYLRPDTWTPLLIQAYRAHDDGSGETPANPVQALNAEANRLLGGAATTFVTTSEDGVAPVPHDATLRFVPDVEGCRFDPPIASAVWSEPSLSVTFRVKADAALDGDTARGSVSIFAGTLLLAEMALVLRVTRDAPESEPPAEAVSASPYRRVFASYSHRDEAVVQQMEVFARAFGDDFMRDVTRLRSGEVWDARIERMIEEADVFQLFWSSNSMGSEYVAREWRHALSLQRPNFVRPVYWEEPLPAAPDRDLPPADLRRIHFQRLPFALPGVRADAFPAVATRAQPAPAPAAARFRPRGRGVLRAASLGMVALLAGILVLDRGFLPQASPPADASPPLGAEDPADDVRNPRPTEPDPAIDTGTIGFGPGSTMGGTTGVLSGNGVGPAPSGGIAAQLLPPPSALRIGPFTAAASDTNLAAIGVDVRRRLVGLQGGGIGTAAAATPPRTLTGRVARAGAGFTIDLEMAHTATGEVEWRTEVSGRSAAHLAARIQEEVASRN